jgi:hypothetical protein
MSNANWPGPHLFSNGASIKADYFSCQVNGCVFPYQSYHLPWDNQGCRSITVLAQRFWDAQAVGRRLGFLPEGFFLQQKVQRLIVRHSYQEREASLFRNTPDSQFNRMKDGISPHTIHRKGLAY